MSRQPCPHCGAEQYGPVDGIGYYCSQGSKCPGITFAKPDTVTITISREDAEEACKAWQTDDYNLLMEQRIAQACFEALVEAALEGER